VSLRVLGVRSNDRRCRGPGGRRSVLWGNARCVVIGRDKSAGPGDTGWLKYPLPNCAGGPLHLGRLSEPVTRPTSNAGNRTYGSLGRKRGQPPLRPGTCHARSPVRCPSERPDRAPDPAVVRPPRRGVENADPSRRHPPPLRRCPLPPHFPCGAGIEGSRAVFRVQQTVPNFVELPGGDRSAW